MFLRQKSNRVKKNIAALISCCYEALMLAKSGTLHTTLKSKGIYIRVYSGITFIIEKE